MGANLLNSIGWSGRYVKYAFSKCEIIRWNCPFSNGFGRFSILVAKWKFMFFSVKKDHYYIRPAKTKVSLALQCNNMLKEMGKVLEETGEKH